MRDLKSDSKGAMLIMVAITLPLIFAVILLVIDLNKAQTAHSDNQGAVDSTALLVSEFILQKRIRDGADPNEHAYIAYGLDNFKSNFNSDDELANIESFEIDVVEDEVRVKVCLRVDNQYNRTTPFIAEGSTTTVCNEAAAILPDVTAIEIAFALDVSYSMLEEIDLNGTRMTKLEALQRALVGDGTTGGLLNSAAVRDKPGVFWAVIPFRGMVDLGANAQNIVASDFGSASYPNEEYRNADKEFTNVRRMIVGDPNNGWEAYLEAKENGVAFPGHLTQVYDVNDQDGVQNYYHVHAANLLGRVALTERANGNDDLAADISPRSNRFKAYWHHPRQYWWHFYRYLSHTFYGGNAHSCRIMRSCGGGTPANVGGTSGG